MLLMVAGAKGAVASTLAVAVAALQNDPDILLPSLTTRNRFSCLPPAHAVHMAGWDTQPAKLSDCVKTYGVVPENIWKPYQSTLDEIFIFQAPPLNLDLKAQVRHLMKEIREIKKQHSNVLPVLINLLPANIQLELDNFTSLSQLYSKVDPSKFPDLAYALASILSDIPLINFSPNPLEIPVIVQQAIKHRVPICGRDGKTGQTYFKLVLASALKARCLHVDGWYSLNILGNADGKNLGCHRFSGYVRSAHEYPFEPSGPGLYPGRPVDSGSFTMDDCSEVDGSLRTDSGAGVLFQKTAGQKCTAEFSGPGPSSRRTEKRM